MSTLPQQEWSDTHSAERVAPAMSKFATAGAIWHARCMVVSQLGECLASMRAVYQVELILPEILCRQCAREFLQIQALGTAGKAPLHTKCREVCASRAEIRTAQQKERSHARKVPRRLCARARTGVIRHARSHKTGARAHVACTAKNEHSKCELFWTLRSTRHKALHLPRNMSLRHPKYCIYHVKPSSQIKNDGSSKKKGNVWPFQDVVQIHQVLHLLKKWPQNHLSCRPMPANVLATCRICHARVRCPAQVCHATKRRSRPQNARKVPRLSRKSA